MDGDENPVVHLGERVCIRSVAHGGHWYSEKHKHISGADWFPMYSDGTSKRLLCLEDLIRFMSPSGTDSVAGSPVEDGSGVVRFNGDVTLCCMTPSKRTGRYLDGSSRMLSKLPRWGKGREALLTKGARTSQQFIFRLVCARYDDEEEEWCADPSRAGDAVHMGDLVMLEVAFEEEKHGLNERYLEASEGWICPTEHISASCVFELLQPDIAVLARSLPGEFDDVPDEVRTKLMLQLGPLYATSTSSHKQ